MLLDNKHLLKNIISYTDYGTLVWNEKDDITDKNVISFVSEYEYKENGIIKLLLTKRFLRKKVYNFYLEVFIKNDHKLLNIKNLFVPRYSEQLIHLYTIVSFMNIYRFNKGIDFLINELTEKTNSGEYKWLQPDKNKKIFYCYNLKMDNIFNIDVYLKVIKDNLFIIVETPLWVNTVGHLSIKNDDKFIESLKNNLKNGF
jgi:hypothetical protein